MKRFGFVIAFVLAFFTVNGTALANENFDAGFYAEKNPDVVEALGNDPEVLYNHYISYGKGEGRLPYEGAVTDVTVPVERLENTSDDIYNEVVNQVGYVPDKLRKCFVDSGWRLILTSENIAQTEFGGQYKSIRGMTSYTNKYIKIHNRMIAAKTAVQHEFGHFLYDLSNRFYGQKQKEICDAFELEKDNLGKALSGTNGLEEPIEFYAEVFFIYCTDNENARNLYPITVAIIDNDLAALE